MLVVLELFLRTTAIQLPGVTRYDDTLGLALKPDRPLVRFDEGFYMGGTNHFGYYGKGHPPEKPKGAFRVALIGDSQVEGHQLFARDHFGAILEAELARLTGVSVEVMNFGMSGLNLSDMYCYFVDFAGRFEPDVTFFLIGAGDIDKSPPRRERPYCELVADSLVINYEFAGSPTFAWKQKTATFRGQSAVLNLVNRAREVYGRGLAPEVLLGKFWPASPARAESPGDVSLTETTRRILEELAGRGDVCLLMADSLPDDVVAAMMEEYGCAIDLRDPLNQVEGDPRYWIATDQVGHWNHEAHKAVGVFLAGELSDRPPR